MRLGSVSQAESGARVGSTRGSRGSSSLGAAEKPVPIPEDHLGRQLCELSSASPAPEAEHPLGAQDGVGLRPALHEPAVVVSLQLAGMRVQRVQDLLEALGAEIGDQRREGQVRPQAPHPPRRRPVLERRQGVERRAAHHLVTGMAIMGARGEDDVDRLLANELGDQRRQLGLRGVEIVAGPDRRGAAGDDQLEPGAPGGLPGLRFAALLILRPPQATGEVDDPMAASLELEHDRGASHQLIVRVGREVQEGPPGRRIAWNAARPARGHSLARSLFVTRGRMNELLLARHGETEWSANGRHTSRTDLPLTDNGRRLARRLAPRLADRRFALVLTSPMRRAVETCELAGLGEEAQVRDELREWDYGDYEGITTAEIQRRRPGWSLWRDGCPNGEIAAEWGPAPTA